MRGQPRIEHPRHLRPGFQPLRHFERIGGLCLHAHGKRFQPLQYHPGVERRQRGSGGAQELEYLFHQRRAAADRTAQHAPLTVQVLGGGMDDEVGAELQGTLQGRCAKTVVDDQQGAPGMRDFGQRRDVEYFGERIGRRLDEHQPGVGSHRGAKGLDAALVDETGLDAEARQDVAEQLLRCAENAARGDDVFAGFHQRHHGRQDCRHAAGRGDAAFGTFKCGETLLQGGDRGVGEAGVDVARLGAGKTCRGLCRVVENEARSEIERFRMLVELATLLPGAHGQGIERPARRIRRTHPAGTRFRSSCSPSGPSKPSWSSSLGTGGSERLSSIPCR